MSSAQQRAGGACACLPDSLAMGDYFDWWWGGGSWYDLKQRDQLDALSASHARTTSMLHSKLREETRRSQDLSTRLARLEDAVVAIVELEDLRGVMETFSDAVSTRRYARDVLARIPALGRVPGSREPEVPPDVPDYWLHPAVRAVDARLRGDAATEQEAANEARRRNPARTAQFLAAVAILMGTTVAEDDLATLWPTSRQVSTYQRSLWLAVANGALGEEARSGLIGALRWVLSRPDAEPEADDALRTVQVRMASTHRGPTEPEEIVTDGLLRRRLPDEAGSAAIALADLRQRVQAALEASPAQPQSQAAPEGVADLLAQVVSSGAPGEEPLVARLVEIRQTLAAIGASTSIAAPALLDEESLDVVELLRADLGEGADPGAHAVAVAALAEPIEKVATRLAEIAAQPRADGGEVRVAGGVTVRYSSAGPVDGGWRAQVAERVAQRTADTTGLIGHVGAGAALAVVGVVLAIVASPGWVVLTAVGLVWGGVAWWRRQRALAERARYIASQVAAAERTVAEKSAALAGDLAATRERQESAPQELQAIRAALAGVRAR